MNTDTEFLCVSDAKKRYLGGTMSLRWWYRQIENGKLPHHRPGGAVRLRAADVEAFIAEMYREKAKPPDDSPPPVSPAPVAVASSRRSKRSGLRFFN